jgi:hypothetical protein
MPSLSESERYQSKDATQTKTFDSLEWLAAMCYHVPNRGKQLVHYYGHYSNVKRGNRGKEVKDEITPCMKKVLKRY